eukprot:3206287-Prorocentrum_lima.AAC.1
MGCRDDFEDLHLGSTRSPMVVTCCARSKEYTSRMDRTVFPEDWKKANALRQPFPTPPMAHKLES